MQRNLILVWPYCILTLGVKITSLSVSRIFEWLLITHHTSNIKWTTSHIFISQITHSCQHFKHEKLQPRMHLSNETQQAQSAPFPYFKMNTILGVISTKQKITGKRDKWVDTYIFPHFRTKDGEHTMWSTKNTFSHFRSETRWDFRAQDSSLFGFWMEVSQAGRSFSFLDQKVAQAPEVG